MVDGMIGLSVYACCEGILSRKRASFHVFGTWTIHDSEVTLSKESFLSRIESFGHTNVQICKAHETLQR